MDDDEMVDMRVMGTWAAMHEMGLGPDVTFVRN
jgi:hypothetical protein